MLIRVLWNINVHLSFNFTQRTSDSIVDSSLLVNASNYLQPKNERETLLVKRT